VSGFLSVKDVSRLVALSPASVWRIAREGHFPVPIKLDRPRRTVWIRAEVERWCEERITEARRAS
jgi:predicted DNA-binding transcriptional regulator AlpA